MDTLIEFALERVAWAADKSGIVLVLLATLPLVLLLGCGRVLRYSALAVFVGAITLILLGIEGSSGAAVVIVANTFLISAAVLSLRKRLVQIEAHLEMAMLSIHNLETTEARRQTFSARNPTELAPGNIRPSSRKDGKPPARFST
ncbi:hypothetical protein IB238_13890 [Rhizobium sp. ARZ01]|uniref:hypothetical protein n=1 Tax=Rhizobium sp. ARZ01 TaxID=2769313 RepID=UPI0017814850|nr:hypothetical protein [Rhizobium sp. ARZ01]MBD9373714.1 hypothetical protein [Rhizobium sp. ARZ01]